MKIGILTFHRAENVGAALQSWALQQYLKSVGHDVYIIDYRCKAIESVYDIWNPRIIWSRWNLVETVKLYLRRLILFRIRRKKKVLFTKFRDENLYLTNSVKGVSSIPLCDTYITGSDQVWNMALTKGYNKFYFLDFPAHRRISYAASTERASYQHLLKVDKEKMSQALRRFDAISVRELWIKDELLLLCPSINISVCLDPVFLLSKEHYNSISKTPLEKDFIFVYQVVESSICNSIAERLASKFNLNIVYMNASQKTYKENHLYVYGPSEFLGYIANAKYVITTSFHGMAFSIIFQKEFWVVDTGFSSRQKNILCLLGLADRFVSSDEKTKFSQISYGEVNERLQKEITESKEWLLNNII